MADDIDIETARNFVRAIEQNMVHLRAVLRMDPPGEGELKAALLERDDRIAELEAEVERLKHEAYTGR